jgi:hypothetical protein
MFSMLVTLLLAFLPQNGSCGYSVSAVVEDVDLSRSAELVLYPRRVTLGTGQSAAQAAVLAQSAIRDGVVEADPAETKAWPAHAVRYVSFVSHCQ